MLEQTPVYAPGRPKMTTFLSLKMSLIGVVENLEETPSSQLRAFWRETLDAAEIMSDPVVTKSLSTGVVWKKGRLDS